MKKNLMVMAIVLGLTLTVIGAPTLANTDNNNPNMQNNNNDNGIMETNAAGDDDTNWEWIGLAGLLGLLGLRRRGKREA